MRVICIFLVALPVLCQTSGVRKGTRSATLPPGDISIVSYGALGDGTTDSTGAIQAAINAVSQAGGGTVNCPAGTYLLNTYRPTSHPWFFYNLLIPSNVTFQGTDAGCQLIQGPGGRAALPKGAQYVANSVIAIANNNSYTTEQWQNPSYNGGFYRANAVTRGVKQVTLAVPDQASHFHVGDYVAMFAAASGIVAADMSQVTSIDPDAGVIGIAEPVSRSISAPLIADVQAVTTHDVTIRNVTIQGAQPVFTQDTFDLTLDQVTILADTSVGGANLNNPFYINLLRRFRITDSLVRAVNGPDVQIEMPQNNSADGDIERNRFYGRTMAWGEYASRWTLQDNSIWLKPQISDATGLLAEGQDIHIIGGAINVSSLTAGSGSGSLIHDMNPADVSYNGGFVMQQVNVTGSAPGNNCIMLSGNDSEVSNNNINCLAGQAIFAGNSANMQAVNISNNVINGSGLNIVLATTANDQCQVKGNTVNVTSGSGYGIYVYDTPRAQGGAGHRILGNVVSGTPTPVYLTPKDHPLSVVDSTGP